MPTHAVVTHKRESPYNTLNNTEETGDGGGSHENQSARPTTVCSQRPSRQGPGAQGASAQTCAADHGVQSAAVASGSWRGARGVTAALRAYVTWHARY